MGKHRNIRRATILGSALGGFALWRFLKAPPPVEDYAYLESRESRVESVRTDDGVTLRVKRYVNEGAQPVLLCHGFNGNGLEYDVPHRGHNLALYLREHGYDVWISSWRGCGREPHVSGTSDWGHSVDQLAAFDAPALVEAVTQATGRKPFWIGHSMGGMILYMYLQGARPAGGGGDGGDGGFRVSTDPDTARQRNDSLAGGITIGSPPGLRHGGADWISYLERLPSYEKIARALLRLLSLLGTRAPLPTRKLGDICERWPRLGRLLAMHGPVAIFLYNAKNVDPDVGYSLIKLGADFVTTRMAAQILAMAVDPDFKGCQGECNYTEHMDWITAPTFFITGTEDFAGPENIRDAYEKVSSAQKRFECYQAYGHTDLVMGKRVLEEVYPDILAWFDEISGRTGAEATPRPAAARE